MKRTILFLLIVSFGQLFTSTIHAHEVDQVTLPPQSGPSLVYQQTTPPDPAEEEQESKDSIQTETPLESFFNGVLEWLYEPEPETKQQTERRSTNRSQQQTQSGQKQKVSIWQ